MIFIQWRQNSPIIYEQFGKDEFHSTVTKILSLKTLQTVAKLVLYAQL